ncbi:hypothetical protein BGZ61DRAFT_464099 [Ilyonectria robusta]|uniref:uncharacterized protein n=1 Tax=Ilyonectria robusta TaxID=1079257 RepID=UPI001E8EAD4C|nr:uncharacterized protein BGZ61DRAFT_464099 [Ilyonectria robusta]KAH8661126.1 hypothetical protein BGZ61DRAFT_464099 [Ilyonectria robusta]
MLLSSPQPNQGRHLDPLDWGGSPLSAIPSTSSWGQRSLFATVALMQPLLGCGLHQRSMAPHGPWVVSGTCFQPHGVSRTRLPYLDDMHIISSGYPMPFRASVGHDAASLFWFPSPPPSYLHFTLPLINYTRHENAQ